MQWAAATGGAACLPSAPPPAFGHPWRQRAVALAPARCRLRDPSLVQRRRAAVFSCRASSAPPGPGGPASGAGESPVSEPDDKTVARISLQRVQQLSFTCDKCASSLSGLSCRYPAPFLLNQMTSEGCNGTYDKRARGVPFPPFPWTLAYPCLQLPISFRYPSAQCLTSKSRIQCNLAVCALGAAAARRGA